MKSLDNLYKLTIGDYWDDGHGKFVTQQFLTNVTSEQMKRAYWDSCKLVGIQFHTNGNATGLPDWEHKNHRDFRVLNGYEDSSISKEAVRKMKEHGLEGYNPYSKQPNVEGIPEYWPWENMLATYGDEEVPTEKDFFHLMMWFIGLSLPKDFYYEVIKEPKDALSEMVGYGLFH